MGGLLKPRQIERVTGDRLIFARHVAGFETVQSAADQTSFHRQTLALWERGRNDPPGRALRELADLYDVSIDWIVGRVPFTHHGGIPGVRGA